MPHQPLIPRGTAGGAAGTSFVFLPRLLLWGGSALFFALLLLCLALLYTAPTIGARFSWRAQEGAWRVESAEPGAGLRRGDVVLRVGGLAADRHLLLNDNIYITGRGELFRWFERKDELFRALAAGRVEVDLLRGGGEIPVDLEVRPAHLDFLGRIESLHLVNALLFFLVGSIVLLRRPLDGAGLVFHLFCLDTAVMFLTFAVPLASDLGLAPAAFRWINVVNYFTFLFSGGFLFHFSLLFPREPDWLRDRRWIPAGYYLAMAALGASLMALAQNIVLVLLCLATVASMTWSCRRPGDDTGRRQVKWMGVGLLLGIGPWLVLNGIPVLLTGQHTLDYSVTALFIGIVPLSIAFAIRKVRLFDIDNLFEKVVVNWLTLVLLSILDVALAGLLGHFLGDQAAPGAAGRAILPLIVLLPAYLLVRDGVRALLRGLLEGLSVRPAAAPAAAAPEPVPREAALSGGGILTRREVEILRAFEQGLGYRQAAERLLISPHTVHTHVKHINEKLGTRTRTGALRRAREAGLL